MTRNKLMVAIAIVVGLAVLLFVRRNRLPKPQPAKFSQRPAAGGSALAPYDNPTTLDVLWN
jgi:hypothetical protein